MSSVLYSLGRWAFRARWLMVGAWIVMLIGLVTGAGLLGVGTNNTYVIPGTESQQAQDSLARTFPQVSGASAQMIVVAPQGSSVTDDAIQSAVDASIASIKEIPQVSGATSPYTTSATSTPTSTPNINTDSSAAIVPIQLSVVQTAVLPSTMNSLQHAGSTLEADLPHGSQVSVGGQVFSQGGAGISVTELVGIAIAFVVLAFAFGSLVAAGAPLVTALLGVGVTLSLVLLTTRFVTITSTTPLLSLMLGLAVGIDYALFIISRHQDQVRHGIPLEESAARAVATAGSAVVFAAITVIIALVGLSVAGIPFLTTMGVAAAAAVAIAVVVSLTLTPALLSIIGMRVVPKRYRVVDVTPLVEIPGDQAEVDGSPPSPASASPATPVPSIPPSTDVSAASDPATSAPRGFFLGWVRVVTHWPVVTIVAVVVLLGLATLPVMSLRLALPDAGSLEEHSPARITYDLIAENFGPGYNGPLIVTGSIIESTDPVGLMKDLAEKFATIPGVAAVPLSTPNQTGDTGIVQVIPKGAPDSQATKDLVARIRSMRAGFEKEYDVDLSVTGYTAAGIDISTQLGKALLPFALLVVGLSLILLAMVFRSIAVPVTAALGYLLSIGTAFGVTSLVFESGYLAGPLNVAALGSVISFMPIILMGVLFGLAMDYEVFLVSRMREDYVHHRDARAAVHRGFVGSAKVVTAAAIIMFAVFAAFIPAGDASIQPIAVGLAVGVAVDAFIVRMTLIPAILILLGDRAWWIPERLGRILPSFDAEGEGLTRELEAADWPEPGDQLVIAAENVRVAEPLDSERRPIGDSGIPHGGFSAMVPSGGVLLIRGESGSGRTPLLYGLSGRTRVTSGRLKVAGYVLPIRAATVRSLSAVVRLARSADPVEDVRDALAAGPRILLIDDLDLVPDRDRRRRIAAALADARDAGDTAGATASLTLVISCRPDAVLDDVLSEVLNSNVRTSGVEVEGETVTVMLPPAPSREPELAVT